MICGLLWFTSGGDGGDWCHLFIYLFSILPYVGKI